MFESVEFKLNGQPQKVEADSTRSLLEVLREDLQLTGTKYGCGQGQCRSCTVLLDGEPVPACRTLLSEVAGHAVETIEGLANEDELHPVQHAFLDCEAMQCGYCVPGMIMETVALLRESPDPQEADIVQALNGHLCRCCGYPNLVKAVRNAAERTPARGDER